MNIYNLKMKYCFELYEFSNKGRIFLGYKTILAANSNEARKIIQSKLPDNVVLAQIYIQQD